MASPSLNPSHPSNAELRARMAATGIGFAGIEGAWWRPAVAPLALPAAMLDELPRIGRALFALYDVLAELYPQAEDLRALLTHRVPARLPWLLGREPVRMVRPDFQLVPDGASYRLVATELEICPAAQGFAHAMQVGHGLATDLADEFARFLRGRLCLIVATARWSEFLFEQLAFCRALAERGAAGYVLFDQPLQAIIEDVTRGQRWTPPMFGIRARPDGWNDDVWGRLRRDNLDQHVWPGGWPDEVGDAVVFRFGYFDCFAPETIGRFLRWQRAGATFLNPPITYLESKSVLAAARLPVVRDALDRRDAGTVAVLDRCLPDTLLLTDDVLPRLLDEREAWVIKYAGFDGGDESWGGRSVRFGHDYSADTWHDSLCEAVDLPWPVVAQRLTPSAQLELDYYDTQGNITRLPAAHTRLRSFLLRDGGAVFAGGTHLTLSPSPQVSEATDTVQAPVVFTLCILRNLRFLSLQEHP